jgi:broad specificity phosphatase PhoE
MAADSVLAPERKPETVRPKPEGETSMLKALTCAFALLLATPAPAPARRFQAPTVIIVVRHAEKAATPANDPPLTLAGSKRAIKLTTITQAVGVDAIFVTQARRTRETAEPTASLLNVPITAVPVTSASANDIAAYAEALKQRILSDHRGQAVLVVGHSNTAPAVAGALGNRTLPNLNDATEFDAVFFVVVPETGQPRLIKARY